MTGGSTRLDRRELRRRLISGMAAIVFFGQRAVSPGRWPARLFLAAVGLAILGGLAAALDLFDSIAVPLERGVPPELFLFVGGGLLFSVAAGVIAIAIVIKLVPSQGPSMLFFAGLVLAGAAIAGILSGVFAGFALMDQPDRRLPTMLDFVAFAELGEGLIGVLIVVSSVAWGFYRALRR